MNIKRLLFLSVHVFLLCFHFRKAGILADFVLDETEEQSQCSPYTGVIAQQLCLEGCSSYCSNYGRTTKFCEKQSPSSYICCCLRVVKIRDGTCQIRCGSRGYTGVYKEATKVCNCICVNSKCKRTCDETMKLGKCKEASLQQPLQSPCTCYCDETCGSKFSTKYVHAYCNEGKCIKECNGTKEISPSWCDLNNDKCGCTCSKEKCKNYCKGKANYGICQEPMSCSCQHSPLLDTECFKYCNDRTNSPPLLKPSKSGHCKCNYVRSAVCGTNCVKSEKCSKLDGCFCKDNMESVDEAVGDVKICQGNLCVSKFELNSDQSHYIIATEKPTGQYGVICLIDIEKGFNQAAIDLIPGVALAIKGEELETEYCLTVYTDKRNKTSFEIKDAYYIVEGNKSDFGFKNMNRNEKIPKEAVKIRNRHYFGRASGGEVIGTVDDKGVMTGGSVTAKDWNKQKPIYPNTFEIFVCNLIATKAP